jgi:predicted transcriptional regulator of viral defense system
MIQLKKNLITKTFQKTKANIFTFAELSRLIHEHIQQWTVENAEQIPAEALVSPKSHAANALADAIVKAGILEKAVLPFPFRQDTRCFFGKVDPLDLVQSLTHDGYFTHFTAIYLNNLTEQTPKTIYFNVEQRLSGGQGQLTQEALNRAFKAEARLSSNVVEYKGTRIVKLNGRNTNQIGVLSKRRPNAGAVRVTDHERTLIDATVRPVYSGGPAVVARAFELAKESVSVNKLASYLRKLRYVYPYHQAVGFYMERAGYEAPLLKLMGQFPIEFDFYLLHGMKSPVLNKRWRLYVPKGF